jgi:TorA maturation chaperone TorD
VVKQHGAAGLWVRLLREAHPNLISLTYSQDEDRKLMVDMPKNSSESQVEEVRQVEDARPLTSCQTDQSAFAATHKTSLDELIGVLESRSEFYLTLAGFYMAPLKQEQIDAMAGADLYAFSAGETLLEEGFNDISRYLRKRNTGTRQMLAVDFTSSFGGAEIWKGRSALPVSSLFLGEHGLLYHDSRDDVFATYKKQALKLRKGADLPEDHLSFELEFLSILSVRSIEALRSGDKRKAVEGLKVSQDFIRGHILVWFRQLSDLANLLISTRFYRGVMKVTEGYLLVDLETIDDLVEEIEGGMQ